MTYSIPDIMAKMPSAFRNRQVVDLDAAVHFKFTGAEAGEWNAVIKDGKCDVAQGLPHFKPTVTLTADSSDFVMIVSGGLDAMQAFMEGRIKLAGDMGLATKLVQILKT